MRLFRAGIMGTQWAQKALTRNKRREASRRSTELGRVERLEERALLSVARIDTRVVLQPSVVDAQGERATLPANQLQLQEWSRYDLEIWLSTPDSDSAGISSVTVDVAYDTRLFSLRDSATAQPETSIEWGAGFESTGVSQIHEAQGRVLGLSASTTATQRGASSFVLLARLHFESLGSDQLLLAHLEHSVGPAHLGITVTNATVEMSDGTVVVPELGAFPETRVFGNIYDLDDSGRVDFGDLAHFVGAFFQQSNHPQAPANTWVADFDHSGLVNFGDFSYFAANFLRARGDGVELVFPSSSDEA